MRFLALIPARGGSKGVPQKNLKELGGIPLIAWSVRSAQEAGCFDRVVVTTDSDSIAKVASEVGAEVPFIRPPALATDETPMLPVVQHALTALSQDGWACDAVVLLQPTTPFRQRADILAATAMLEETHCDSVVSVIPVPLHYNPYWALELKGSRLRDVVPGGREITRRQDLPDSFVRDGSIYVTRTEVIQAGSLYGQDARAIVLETSVNIDTEEDWLQAEGFVERLKARPSS